MKEEWKSHLLASTKPQWDENLLCIIMDQDTNRPVLRKDVRDLNLLSRLLNDHTISPMQPRCGSDRILPSIHLVDNHKLIL